MLRCGQGIMRWRTERGFSRGRGRLLSALRLRTGVIAASVRRLGLRYLIGPILAAVVAASPGNYSECRGDEADLRERVRKEFPAALEPPRGVLYAIKRHWHTVCLWLCSDSERAVQPICCRKSSTRVHANVRHESAQDLNDPRPSHILLERPLAKSGATAPGRERVRQVQERFRVCQDARRWFSTWLGVRRTVLLFQSTMGQGSAGAQVV